MITDKNDMELVIRYSSGWMLLPAGCGIAFGILGLAAFLLLHGGAVFAVIGLLFIVTGITVIIKATSQQTLIKRDGTVTCATKKLVGGKTTTKNYPTNTVRSVAYAATYNSSQSAQYRAASSISLVMADNSKLMVDYQWAYPYPRKTANWKTPANEPLAEEAKTIATFLSVPLTNSK